MGLPIWRDPEEKKSTEKDNGSSRPPTATERVISSRIQRRASIHGPRSRARAAQRRQHFLAYPPSLPPTNDVVHIPTLLETVDSTAAPPPAPEPTRFSDNVTAEQEPEEPETLSRARRITQRRRLLEDTNRVTSSISSSYPRALPSAEPGENPAQFEIRTANDIMNAIITSNLPTPPIEAPAITPSDQQTQDGPRIDGLGDRNRSPTPAQPSPAQESWSPLRATIAPDSTLPSADSSFTSAEASRSFASSSTSTSVAGEDDAGTSQNNRSNTASVSSVDFEDLCADDEEESGMLNTTEALARDFYLQELETPAGRERIARQENLHVTEGNRYALSGEPATVDIGFRLIEAALERVEEARREHLTEHSAQWDGYMEALTRLARLSDTNRLRRQDRASSTAAVQAEENTSADELRNYPVIVSSQPTPLSLNEILRDAESGGHGQDLDAMRLIVERLAARDDVPDEWWMSMGLNLSRTRPRRPRRWDGRMAARAARLEMQNHGMINRRNGRNARSITADRDRESRL